jgi:hypothetical protein
MPKPAASMPRDGFTFFFAKIFPAIFALPGAAMLCFGAQQVLEAHQSSGWPTVNGKVVVAEVTRDGRYYAPVITYEYKVRRQRWTGYRISFGDARRGGVAGLADAKTIVNRYETGKSVRVYYHPDRPQDSLLEPGLANGNWVVWFLPGIGLLFLSVGVGVYVVIPKFLNSFSDADDALAHRNKHSLN